MNDITPSAHFNEHGNTVVHSLSKYFRIVCEF